MPDDKLRLALGPEEQAEHEGMVNAPEKRMREVKDDGSFRRQGRQDGEYKAVEDYESEHEVRGTK